MLNCKSEEKPTQKVTYEAAVRDYGADILPMSSSMVEEAFNDLNTVKRKINKIQPQ